MRKLLFAICMTAVASLSQPCDQLVVPPNNRILPDAEELRAKGADLHVIVIDTMKPEPNLDMYEKNLQDRCASWRSPNGGMKSNLLVVLVDTGEHKTGIYYNPSGVWRRALNSRWTQIQSEQMNPRFRNGDISGGIAAGLRAISAAIEEQYETQHANITPPVVVKEAATDWSWLRPVLLYCLSILSLALCAIWLLYLLREKRELREKVDGARAGMMRARQVASDLVTECTTGLVAFDAKSKPEVQGLIDQAVQTFSMLDGNPSSRESVGYLTSLMEGYDGVANTLRLAKSKLAGEAPPPAPSSLESHSTPTLEDGEEKARKEINHPRRNKHHSTFQYQSAGSDSLNILGGSSVYIHETHVHDFVPEYIPVSIPTPPAYTPTPAPLYNPPEPTPTSDDSSDSVGGGSSDWGVSSDSSSYSDSCSSDSSDSGGGSSDWS